MKKYTAPQCNVFKLDNDTLLAATLPIKNQYNPNTPLAKENDEDDALWED